MHTEITPCDQDTAQAAEKGLEQSLPLSPGLTDPYNTLISDFYLSELQNTDFLLFMPPSL